MDEATTIRLRRYIVTATGTSYHEDTIDAVIEVLERVRLDKTRIHIRYGETQGANAGRDWMESCDTTGRVSRSWGPTKVPILLYNRRSLGGAAILANCIVRIQESKGGRVLFQHPNYHAEETQFGDSQ